MADFTQAPRRGAHSGVHPEYSVAPATPLSKLTNLTGAAVSLALVIGVGVWGYKLLVRDVSGIPVVRAAAGEMRIRPENPGGQLAQHQGLSVNTVTAIGSSEARADELRLAPQPTGLEDEDQPVSQAQSRYGEPSEENSLPPDVQQALVEGVEAPDAQAIAAALQNGSVDDLVAQLTAGVTPLDDLAGESVPVLASVRSGNVPALLSGDGMRVSLRPALRPVRSGVSPSTPPVTRAPSNAELEAGTLPAGTRLVQLGAFDTPEIARAQWNQLNTRFAPFMEGKNRIVMEAKSGGRTFYRLRAEGFDDIGDARRFCSALVAESVDCIPVVTR